MNPNARRQRQPSSSGSMRPQAGFQSAEMQSGQGFAERFQGHPLARQHEDYRALTILPRHIRQSHAGNVIDF